MAQTIDSGPETASAAQRVFEKLRYDREQLQKRIDRAQVRPVSLSISLLSGATLAGYLAWTLDAANTSAPWFYYAVLPLGALGAAAFFWIGVLYVRGMLLMLRNNLDRQLSVAGAEALQATIEEDFFTKLVKINFKYIDQYYLQTQAQADKSFSLSATVASIGLLVIVAGIVMMFLGRTQPAYLTTASGILGEFIAAIFFYLYNRTVIKMGEYHQKLVLTQNVSLALKIAEGMADEERAKAQFMLVDRLSADVNRYLVLPATDLSA